MLTAGQRSHWDDNGVLLLHQHFSTDDVEAVNQYLDDLWSTRQTRLPILVDLVREPEPRRVPLRDAPADARGQLIDLHLESELVRKIALERRLSTVLEDLLGGKPLLVNCLNLEWGTQQVPHSDSLFVSVPGKLPLVAAWFALEDVSMDAGPLYYYPGSHRIPPYVFSNGDTRAVEEEMPAYTAYMTAEVKRRGLRRERLGARGGDVLLWHGQLYHGGESIRDETLSRRSMITHYWRVSDLPETSGTRVEVGPGRYYFKRDPLPPPA